jgi:hypothetical protein
MRTREKRRRTASRGSCTWESLRRAGALRLVKEGYGAGGGYMGTASLHREGHRSCTETRRKPSPFLPRFLASFLRNSSRPLASAAAALVLSCSLPLPDTPDFHPPSHLPLPFLLTAPFAPSFLSPRWHRLSSTVLPPFPPSYADRSPSPAYERRPSGVSLEGRTKPTLSLFLLFFLRFLTQLPSFLSRHTHTLHTLAPATLAHPP